MKIFEIFILMIQNFMKISAALAILDNLQSYYLAQMAEFSCFSFSKMFP